MTKHATLTATALAPEEYQQQKKASPPRYETSTPLERLTLIHHHLQQITASWEPNSSTLKPRKLHRMAFSEILILTPLCERSLRPVGESLLIHGHDLSLGGISFSHKSPLIYCDVAITFFQPDDTAVTIATKLKWCRFSQKGYYFSGGHFLKLLELEQLNLDNRDQFASA